MNEGVGDGRKKEGRGEKICLSGVGVGGSGGWEGMRM